ncbi:hypothetical protein A2160_00740 [Candidatus Beckwithbacteria bacterium RBG_13_42_9]|uniref:TrbL/VirB6 plasmid conjugal transfer protein n=1 Tax=Candidatus Beckwithbacteria bacterium RBG_13_42_9 TaxID=1797457 RepID=A0A1F5E4S1_9BACT|nr:MAG: hypothetical protein A2160_00740 [Candidatus Beckwithbacteria bacterium RBG_13_42_9]
MSKIFKALGLAITLFLLSGILWAKGALAAPVQPNTSNSLLTGPWQMPTTYQVQQNALSTESFSGEGYNSAFLGWTAANLSGYLVGILPGVATQTNAGGTKNGGAVGAFGGLIAQMTAEPPAHMATYVADLMDTAGFTTPAYAQGTGFKALSPVLPVWKAFRNIAYAGFVIIFVVIGFMIMFRSKINPQTVISVEAALPQIVITLLLITFSYAIAAFMIDLIYLLIYLVMYTFKAFGLLDDLTKSNDLIFNTNLIKGAFNFLASPGQVAGTASSAVKEIVGNIFANAPEDITKALGFTASVIAYLIFAVAILIAVFKLFFQLLLAYIGIIFNVIFAPILLLFNALPGSNSFSSWLKNIFANAVVFPVTAILLLISAILTGNTNLGVAADVGYGNLSPTEAPNILLPFIGGGLSTNAFQALLGIGFLMIMPKIVEIIQKMLGIEGGFAGMAGAALGGLQSGAQWTMKGAGATRGFLIGQSQNELMNRGGILADRTLPTFLGGGKVGQRIPGFLRGRR